MAKAGGPQRWRAGAVLTLGGTWMGLVIGTAVGATRVPPGSGLAGPAIALGYGVVAALAMAAAGAATAWLASDRWLRVAVAVTAIVSVLAAAAVAWRVGDLDRQRKAASERVEPLPPPAGFSITATSPEGQANRSFRRLDFDGRTFRARWTSAGPVAQECEAALTGAEAGAIVAALAALEARLETEPEPCDRSAESVLELTWRADGPPAAELRLSVEPQCRSHVEEIAELSRILWRLPIDATGSGRTTCQG